MRNGAGRPTGLYVSTVRRLVEWCEGIDAVKTDVAEKSRSRDGYQPRQDERVASDSAFDALFELSEGTVAAGTTSIFRGEYELSVITLANSVHLLTRRTAYQRLMVHRVYSTVYRLKRRLFEEVMKLPLPTAVAHSGKLPGYLPTGIHTFPP